MKHPLKNVLGSLKHVPDCQGLAKERGGREEDLSEVTHCPAQGVLPATAHM